MQDPTTQYVGPKSAMSASQAGPGLEQQMSIKPDAGEETYRGTGRLTGQKTLVTGADSGIGRAVAIAFAREGADIADHSTEQFDQTDKTNVYAIFWLCQAAVAHMPPGSTIVNTGSLEGYQPSPILVDYASTKWAINGFSKAFGQRFSVTSAVDQIESMTKRLIDAEDDLR